MSHQSSLGWRPRALGTHLRAQGYLGASEEIAEQAAASSVRPSVEEMLRLQGQALARIQRSSEESLMWRKIATGAAIAGALFAAVRLSDIYFAVKARRAR